MAYHYNEVTKRFEKYPMEECPHCGEYKLLRCKIKRYHSFYNFIAFILRKEGKEEDVKNFLICKNCHYQE